MSEENGTSSLAGRGSVDSSAPDTEDVAARYWTMALATVALVFGAIVFVKMVPVAGGADASGYMNSARLLSDGNLFEPLRRPDAFTESGLRESLFQPLGYNFNREQQMLAPLYPTGLPLLLSLGGIHDSPALVRAVYAVVAILAIVGMWVLAGGFGFGRAWRFYAAAMLATSPLFLWSSLILMSDQLATCLAIWALVSGQNAARSRNAALIAGFLIGWSVLTRPTNVLLFFPLALILWQRKTPWGNWLWLMSGGLPAAIWFLWTNRVLHGGWLSSGYGDFWSVMRLEFVWPTLLHYLTKMPVALCAVVIPTSVLALFWVRDRLTWVLLAWALPIFGFYAFYFFTGQTWWFLRFVMVAFPALILLSALFLRNLVLASPRLFGRREGVVVVFLSLFALVWGAFSTSELRVFKEQEFERRYLEEVDWANFQLAADTLVVSMQASGALYYYSDFAVFRWDLASDEDWLKFQSTLTRSSQPVVAILHEFEEERPNSLLKALPGQWELIAEIHPRIRAYAYLR